MAEQIIACRSPFKDERVFSDIQLSQTSGHEDEIGNSISEVCGDGPETECDEISETKYVSDASSYGEFEVTVLHSDKPASCPAEDLPVSLAKNDASNVALPSSCTATDLTLLLENLNLSSSECDDGRESSPYLDVPDIKVSPASPRNDSEGSFIEEQVVAPINAQRKKIIIRLPPKSPEPELVSKPLINGEITISDSGVTEPVSKESNISQNNNSFESTDNILVTAPKHSLDYTLQSSHDTDITQNIIVCDDLCKKNIIEEPLVNGQEEIVTESIESLEVAEQIQSKHNLIVESSLEVFSSRIISEENTILYSPVDDQVQSFHPPVGNQEIVLQETVSKTTEIVRDPDREKENFEEINQKELTEVAPCSVQQDLSEFAPREKLEIDGLGSQDFEIVALPKDQEAISIIPEEQLQNSITLSTGVPSVNGVIALPWEGENKIADTYKCDNLEIVIPEIAQSPQGDKLSNFENSLNDVTFEHDNSLLVFEEIVDNECKKLGTSVESDIGNSVSPNCEVTSFQHSLSEEAVTSPCKELVAANLSIGPGKEESSQTKETDSKNMASEVDMLEDEQPPSSLIPRSMPYLGSGSQPVDSSFDGNQFSDMPSDKEDEQKVFSEDELPAVKKGPMLDEKIHQNRSEAGPSTAFDELKGATVNVSEDVFDCFYKGTGKKRIGNDRNSILLKFDPLNQSNVVDNLNVSLINSINKINEPSVNMDADTDADSTLMPISSPSTLPTNINIETPKPPDRVRKDNQESQNCKRCKDLEQILKKTVEEDKAKLDKVKMELLEYQEKNQTLNMILVEYEKTISHCVTNTENVVTKENESLKKEKDDALLHLANMEVAFNDVHLKYEKCKAAIEKFKSNEEKLQANLAESLEKNAALTSKYQKLKDHATEKLNEANVELANMKKSHQSEISAQKIMYQKLEVKCRSLQATVEQEKLEKAELNKICDTLVEKLETGH